MPKTFCTRCGRANQTGLRFCAGCGAPLAGLSPSARPPRKKLRGLGPLLRWVAAAVVTVALLGASFYFLTASTELVTSYEEIPSDTETQTDDGLLAGVEYTKTPGRPGTVQVRTKVWRDDAGAVEDREVVWRRVVEPAQTEVVVSGSRSQYETETDVRSLVDQYVSAWKAGRYADMLSLCETATLSDYDVAVVEDACATVGERVSDAVLAETVVSGAQTVLTADADWDDDEPLIAASLTPGAVAVAHMAGTIQTQSAMLGEQTYGGGLRLIYGDGGWRVLYDGPLKCIDVNESERFVSENWGDHEVGRVTLESVVLYGDRIALVVSESNLTRGDDEWDSIDSQFRNLGSGDLPLFSDDTVAGTAYEIDDDLTSSFWDVPKDETQRGVIWLRPGLPPGATRVTVRLPNATFTDIGVM